MRSVCLIARESPALRDDIKSKASFPARPRREIVNEIQTTKAPAIVFLHYSSTSPRPSNLVNTRFQSLWAGVKAIKPRRRSDARKFTISKFCRSHTIVAHPFPGHHGGLVLHLPAAEGFLRVGSAADRA